MLEPKGPVALYFQLESKLRQDLEAGRFKPGDSLTAENELATKYGVSRVTVRRALDRLEEDGLLIRRRGARTIVSQLAAQLCTANKTTGEFRGFEDELRDRTVGRRAELLEVNEGTVPEFIASRLQVPIDADVIRVRRLGRIGPKPVWLESRFFPLDVGRVVAEADLAHASILEVLRKAGVQVTSVEMQLQPVLPTPRQAKLLQVAASQPLWLHESVSYVGGRRPVQVIRVYLRGDLYRVVLHARPIEDGPGLELTGGGYVVTDSSSDDGTPADLSSGNGDSR
jgi:GntR family transcriptional regulator